MRKRSSVTALLVAVFMVCLMGLAGCSGGGGGGSTSVSTPINTEGGVTVNIAPTITSANYAFFTTGAAVSFTVAATGTPKPTLSVSGVLPTGVTFNPATGVLSGTAATLTDGVYYVTFTASNGVSPEATQFFTLTVTTNAVTPAPVVPTPPPPAPPVVNKSTNIVKYGDLIIVRAAPTAAKVAVSFTDPYIITGLTSENRSGAARVTPDGTATPPSKTVVLNDRTDLPSPYPNSFATNGKSYLLFVATNNSFALYTQGATTDTQVQYARDLNTFDFSAISTFANNSIYEYKNFGVISNPAYSVIRKTLYFTFSWWVADSIKGDYIKIRIFQSKLAADGKTFLTPTEVAGEMDPLSGVHYVDGKSRLPTDFPGRLGLWWIGRMYMTADGKKAYFNVLNTANSNQTGVMKPGDAFNAPTPNFNNFGTSGVTSLRDPRLIATYVCSADVDDAGNFTNIKQLPATVNTGGINFVSDISNDGLNLVISHMDLDAAFWSYGWGPDGLAMRLMFDAPWDVAPWTGYGIVWQNAGGTWTQVYKTTSNGTPVVP